MATLQTNNKTTTLAWSILISVLLVLNVTSIADNSKSADNTTVATIDHFYYQQPGDRLQFVFDVNAVIAHTVFRLSKPERVVIDFMATNLAKGLSIKAQTQSPLVSLRHAPRADGSYRVVLDLEKKMDMRSLVEKTQHGERLIVELLKDKVSSHSGSPKIVEAAPRKLVIAIDAGHGGKDPGAIGKRGTKEKVIVLQIAKALEKLFKNTPGYQSVLVRSSDRFISLRDRIEFARQSKADLFISIHADAAINRKAKGASVYTLSATGATSEAARWLAHKENNADLVGGVRLNDKDDMLASVLLDLSQRHTNESSQQVANVLLEEISRVGVVHKDTVEKAGFVVLKSPDIPSVLVESAFISNPSEEKKLLNKKHQLKLAKAIHKGIKKYFKRHAPEGTIIASMRKAEHVIRSGDTLSGIAVRYNVTLKQLRRHNKLRTDNIRIGQTLKIPLES